MAASHGSKAKFRVDDSGGTERDLSSYLSSVGMPRTADTGEVSTLGMTSKAYIPGLKDGTIPIAGPFDPTVDGYLEGILGVERDFQYDPAGTATGRVRYAGACILNAYQTDTPVGDPATFSGTFQVTGEVVRSIQA